MLVKWPNDLVGSARPPGRRDFSTLPHGRRIPDILAAMHSGDSRCRSALRLRHPTTVSGATDGLGRLTTPTCEFVFAPPVA